MQTFFTDREGAFRKEKRPRCYSPSGSVTAAAAVDNDKSNDENPDPFAVEKRAKTVVIHNILLEMICGLN